MFIISCYMNMHDGSPYFILTTTTRIYEYSANINAWLGSLLYHKPKSLMSPLFLLSVALNVILLVATYSSGRGRGSSRGDGIESMG